MFFILLTPKVIVLAGARVYYVGLSNPKIVRNVIKTRVEALNIVLEYITKTVTTVLSSFTICITSSIIDSTILAGTLKLVEAARAKITKVARVKVVKGTREVVIKNVAQNAGSSKVKK